MKINKSLLTLVSCCGLITLFTGCASVICGSKQNITLDSKPGGAEVVVYDAHCDVVFRGITPCVASLRRCEPEEGRASYIILVKKEGFVPVQIPLNGRVNRAYLANALYGGVGLITDPITGAMWTLSSTRIDPQLLQEEKAFARSEKGFAISLREQVSDSLAA